MLLIIVFINFHSKDFSRFKSGSKIYANPEQTAFYLHILWPLGKVSKIGGDMKGCSEDVLEHSQLLL